MVRINLLIYLENNKIKITVKLTLSKKFVTSINLKY